VSRLTLYSREGCCLCDELLLELAPWANERDASIEVRDVDDDPVLKRRFGLKIPVLLVDGEPVAYGRLDWVALEQAWNARR
jgi:hypothetical protein